MSRVVTIKPFIRENSSLAHLGIEYHSRQRLRVKVRTPKTDALDAIPRQLDRIVPAEGYVMENMAAACKRCNMVKSRWLSFDEMRKVAEVLGWRE